MQCSQCNTENKDKSKFCINCGAKLAAPTCFCTECGAEVKAGMRFCGQCGHETARLDKQESVTNKATAAMPGKKKKVLGAIIAIVTAIIVVGGGMLFLTGSSESPAEEGVALINAITDNRGLAGFNLDGETILVSVVDEASPSQALSSVKVSLTRQQGINLVYAKDRRGDYYPKLTFLDSSSTRLNGITVAMKPVGNESWTISQPMTIGISPKLLPEVHNLPYSGLLAFLEDEYPGFETIVFIFDDKVEDLTSSTVTISEAPYPGVIYAYLQQEHKTAGFELIKKAHAIEPVTLLAVTASIVAATFDIPTSGLDLLVHLGKCYGEAQAGSPYTISMPDLRGRSEHYVARELEESGFGHIPVEVLDEDIIEKGYVKNAGDVKAVNLAGFVVRQLPEPNVLYDCDPDERYYRMPDKVFVWIGRLFEERVKEEPKEKPESIPEEESQEEPESIPEEEPEEEPDIEEQVPNYLNISLDSDFSVYYVSHESHPCLEIIQVIDDGKASFRCEQASASWRLHYVKEIDTLGVSKLRIKADLSLIDHARFFIESDGVGVKYDDYVDLMVLSSDPRPTFDRECNKILSKEDWSQCGIVNTNPSVLGHSGVPIFTESRACDFEVDVAGLDTVYLVLRVADAWLADVEGTLSNLQIYYLKS